MYSVTLSLTSAPDVVDGQRHASAALPAGKTLYPLYRWLGGVWNTYGGYKTNVQGFENCVLLGSYAAISGNSLSMFRDNLSVPSARVKKPKLLDPWRWDRYFAAQTWYLLCRVL